MQRRPFIKLLGASISGIPFLSGIENEVAQPKQHWQSWLEQFLRVCPIESLPTSFVRFIPLPELPSAVKKGEFTVAEKNTFFYHHRNYCFQVFEKVHASVGVVDLMIPFWKRQSESEWTKIATLSIYDLKALAEASYELKDDLADYLLPLEPTHQGQYLSAKGKVSITSYVQLGDDVTTRLHITKDAESIWKSKSFSV